MGIDSTLFTSSSPTTSTMVLQSLSPPPKTHPRQRQRCHLLGSFPLPYYPRKSLLAPPRPPREIWQNIRIGPNSLSFTYPSVLKELYGHKKDAKDLYVKDEGEYLQQEDSMPVIPVALKDRAGVADGDGIANPS